MKSPAMQTKKTFSLNFFPPFSQNIYEFSLEQKIKLFRRSENESNKREIKIYFVNISIIKIDSATTLSVSFNSV